MKIASIVGQMNRFGFGAFFSYFRLVSLEQKLALLKVGDNYADDDDDGMSFASKSICLQTPLN